MQSIRLFISEWDGWCDCLQTTAEHDVTSYESFELEIMVNYPVHTWTENDSFTRNLTISYVRNVTSWSVPFWLVLLTEHEVRGNLVQVRWKIFICHTISATLPSTCQNLLNLAEIWWISYRNLHSIFETLCICMYSTWQFRIHLYV